MGGRGGGRNFWPDAKTTQLETKMPTHVGFTNVPRHYRTTQHMSSREESLPSYVYIMFVNGTYDLLSHNDMFTKAQTQVCLLKRFVSLYFFFYSLRLHHHMWFSNLNNQKGLVTASQNTFCKFKLRDKARAQSTKKGSKAATPGGQTASNCLKTTTSF